MQDKIQEFLSNADRVEKEALERNHSEAVRLLELGFTPKMVANKTFTSVKEILVLKEKLGL